MFLPFPRLVKGDGEIIEEIVSKERHKAINKVRGLIFTTLSITMEPPPQATLGDGSSFQVLTRNLM